MARDHKGTILDILKTAAELMNVAIDIYQSPSAPKKELNWLKSLALHIHNKTQELP